MFFHKPVIFLFFVLFLAPNFSLLAENANSLTQLNKPLRIINGERVAENKYPWVAGILRRQNKDAPYSALICGGSLIDKQWVLTAAHCVTNQDTRKLDGSQYSVWLGSTDLYSDNGIVIDAIEIIPNPEWAEDVYDGDIALLKLAQPVNITPLKITGMSYDQYNFPAGTLSTTMGWGATEFNGSSYSPFLLEVDVPIVEQQTCSTAMAKHLKLDEKLMCAGYKTGGKDSCYGDSGGPLIVNKQGQIELLGIVNSGGTLCAQANEYGVYTRVERYADWISETVCQTQEIYSNQPAYQLNVSNHSAGLSINQAGNDSHRLYYAPAPSMTPIAYIDLNLQKNYSTPLPSGSEYFVAIRAYQGVCTSRLSAIEKFKVE